MYRLDPESQKEDSPTALELAAVNGHFDSFVQLIARLKIAPDDEWFQMAQVGLGCSGKKWVTLAKKHYKNLLELLQANSNGS